ncbi:MAG: gamma-glutamyl-gamma-aminobutyrate hydrolase family protein [Phycisphaerae bacterium]|nr:gamma-glutamyl-gamma-aminobutyrate hydrolase family protein [Phycisphaerae bacterium]
MPDGLRPIIGITANMDEDSDGARYVLRRNYAAMVVDAGGAPIILPHEPTLAALSLRCCDGVILSGGADIDVREFGRDLHPCAVPMHPCRQRGEFELLEALGESPDLPVLGICLGMQLLGMHAGATLVQHLDDAKPDAERHRGDRAHRVDSEFGAGAVTSSHHQALADAGSFEVIGRSDDGVIEAIRDPSRPFVVGVQWHPERTADERLGIGVIRALVEAAKQRADRLRARAAGSV